MQADASGRLVKAEEERQFLNQLNDTLLSNQKDYQVGAACAVHQLPCPACVGRSPLHLFSKPASLNASRCLHPMLLGCRKGSKLQRSS